MKLQLSKKTEQLGSIIFYSIIIVGLTTLMVHPDFKDITFESIDDDLVKFVGYLVLVWAIFIGVSIYHLVMSVGRYWELKKGGESKA